MKNFFSTVFKGLTKGAKAVLDGFGHVLIFLVIVIAWLPVHILFPTKVVGKRNLKAQGGRILVCNHFSNLDAILLVFFLRPFKRMKFLAKKELKKFAPLGWVLRILGAIYIDRDNLDIKAIKETSAELKKGKIVTIFAEGTRNKTESEDLQALKGGSIFFATSTGSFIIPARIIHRPKLFKKNYIVIGAPYKPERGNKEQKEKEILTLTQKMDELRSKAITKGE